MIPETQSLLLATQCFIFTTCYRDGTIQFLKPSQLLERSAGLDLKLALI